MTEACRNTRLPGCCGAPSCPAIPLQAAGFFLCHSAATTKAVDFRVILQPSNPAAPLPPTTMYVQTRDTPDHS
jgi:hypothetical protein